MDDSALVKAMFNDLYVLFNANKGVLALCDKYKDSSLFRVLIGNLDLAVVSDPNAIMKETYAFYKRYADRELNDSDWDSVVEDFKHMNQAWDNEWCKQQMLELLGILEAQEKARKTKNAA
ncbi:hypothetical protein [Enterocloster bolteae]|uniref:hypothetical protein n=1 Tax=Enterocloster bolteae TaxID=208479 RepID=UPI0028DB07E8|nr:hypothetical protein [Enterocloster bolteae]